MRGYCDNPECKKAVHTTHPTLIQGDLVKRYCQMACLFRDWVLTERSSWEGNTGPAMNICPRCQKRVAWRIDGQPSRHKIIGGEWCGGYESTMSAFELYREEIDK